VSPLVNTVLLSPGHAADLLDNVVYDQVCELIDLAGLADLEMRLAIEIGRLGGTSDDEMLDLSRAMIDRALLRLADDEHRYMRGGTAEDDELRTRYANCLTRGM
jgi:hypothetical protein